MHRGLTLAGGALALALLGGWLATTSTSPTPAMPAQNRIAADAPNPVASAAQNTRASPVDGMPARSAPVAGAVKKTLGDSLAMGVESLDPLMALETARAVARCASLQQDVQQLDERMGREEAGAYKTQMLRDKEALMAQEGNCQTLPADIRTQGDAFQLRARLLRHAYAAHVPGAAAELLGVPQQFAGLPINELSDRAAEDARAGDIPTLAAWALLKAQADDLESRDFKVFAFALQRASGNPALKEEVSQAQALYARVLERYWAKRYPDQKQSRPLGFNMDKQGVLLYPQGFDEPRDPAYLAQARAMDAALANAVQRMRKTG